MDWSESVDSGKKYDIVKSSIPIDEAVGCLSGIDRDRFTPLNIKAVMIVAFAEEEVAVDSILRLIPIVAVVAIA